MDSIPGDGWSCGSKRRRALQPEAFRLSENEKFMFIFEGSQWRGHPDLCWSSFFGHADRLFDCRLLLEGIGWQVAQFGVQPHAVVEGHIVETGNESYRFLHSTAVAKKPPRVRIVAGAPGDRQGVGGASPLR